MLINDIAKRVFFFYTTYPKCAKIYDRNYMVDVAEIQTRQLFFYIRLAVSSWGSCTANNPGDDNDRGDVGCH